MLWDHDNYNSDINAIITTNILQNQTRSLLKNIAKVLIKLNRGQLFDENIDTGFTIFNHYILLPFPILIKRFPPQTFS